VRTQARLIDLRRRFRPCDALCLDSDGEGKRPGVDTYVVSGTVPLDAEATTYPLVGPSVPSSSRRIFLADLDIATGAGWSSCAAESSRRPPDTIGPPPEPPENARRRRFSMPCARTR
jgi:hypothetical protein